jgi:REP element-mobilizing transposase RayT
MPDHVHMLLSIPPKHSVSQVVGFIKGLGEQRAHVLLPKLENGNLEGGS